METPTNFVSALFSCFYFLPFFVLLLILGLVKGIVFGSVACLLMTIGNISVIIGLWPAHFIWTYVTVIRAKILGPYLKVLLCLVLPVPLLLWPPIGVAGSILAAVGYGIIRPLVATFEAIGEKHQNKFMDCMLDGTWSIIKGSCTVVRDFTDFCFHSFFSIMDELSEQQPKDGIPTDIKLLVLPGCLIVGWLGMLADVPAISIIALLKSPCMLFKGWNRLLHDLIGREGPFLETVCVPFAGLAIILWPLVVGLALAGAIVSSFFVGAYAAVVVYKESSLKYGLAYVVSAISLFDEYSNDMLYLREGSCFPRPMYTKKSIPLSGVLSRRFSSHSISAHSTSIGKSGTSSPHIEKRPGPQRGLSLRENIQKLGTLQIWDFFFESFERNGKMLVEKNIIQESDMQEWVSTGKSNVLNVGLPAYCLLQNVLLSAKSNSDGFLLPDGSEITPANRPDGIVFDWFFEPLLIIKEQIRRENLDENEELYLSGLALLNGLPDRLKAWLNGRQPPTDDFRRAELEALGRRLQGIARSLSRMPTFRRKFEAVVKYLHQTREESLADKEGSLKKKVSRLFSQRSKHESTNGKGFFSLPIKIFSSRSMAAFHLKTSELPDLCILFCFMETDQHVEVLKILIPYIACSSSFLYTKIENLNRLLKFILNVVGCPNSLACLL